MDISSCNTQVHQDLAVLLDHYILELLHNERIHIANVFTQCTAHPGGQGLLLVGLLLFVAELVSHLDLALCRHISSRAPHACMMDVMDVCMELIPCIHIIDYMHTYNT